LALQEPEILRLFNALDQWTPERLPSTGSLSRLVTSLNTAIGAVVPETEVVLFATGAVEMWRRALYTLILAAMLQDVNVSWGCVAGYYASHYCVRAFAQLFGYFAVYRHRVFVEVSPYGGTYRCNRVQPLSNQMRREHRFYWAMIKRQPRFDQDRLFTTNDDRVSLSDSAHRGFASYADHLYENFRPYPAIERSQLRARLIDLATTSLSGEDSMPIPDRDEYPDLVTVLSVAYLRIYRFREYLDELLPAGGGRFWKTHRSPTWSIDLFHFPPRPN